MLKMVNAPLSAKLRWLQPVKNMLDRWTFYSIDTHRIKRAE
jgi:hypothetical protein